MGGFIRSKLFLLGLLPLIISVVVGSLVLASLYWSTGQMDMVAAQRQRDLVSLIVSNMRTEIAHDQESATVWDDAVTNTSERNLEWLEINLGKWMHSYFMHDAAFVLAADNSEIYHFITEEHSANRDNLRRAYAPLVTHLRQRLLAGDTTGVTDRVLSIGESDFAAVGSRPAIISIKPIISDTGELEQQEGKENLHVAVRFLDGTFPGIIGGQYQFEDMHFTRGIDDIEHAHVPLMSSNGEMIGYMCWKPFHPGSIVKNATLPALAAGIFFIFGATSALGSVLFRRSERLSASRAELHRMAHHDVLTGLANRVSFNETLEKGLNTALPESVHGVLFIDLDRFKAVNDTFGHPAGDRLITMVGERLQEVLPHAVTARFGGDEFTAFLKNVTGPMLAEAADGVVHAMQRPFDLGSAMATVGASVGAALATGETDATELTRQADIALFHAKAAGRNRYALYGDHMDELLRARRELESDLRHALDTRTQIETHFQPVYSVASGKMCSVEALVRWRHPARGLIDPDVFIPVAEETGLISTLGSIVLEDACAAIAPWANLPVAVNASPAEMKKESYPLKILSILARHNILPERLEIEITEGLLLDSTGQCQKSIAALRKAGVRFAIDDFGTGYSSFGRVQDIGVDRIKIDKVFVDELARSGNRGIIAGMISMARAKGLEITAEGVETAEQREILTALGCDHLQVFLLSRPLTADQLDALRSKRESAAS
ncbi:putative bifunctional diguanylate cyclase/phosphodiesterase [Phyllobacterium ifriqiyense]|uniref:putative bifunctional diguanylate cyclase/phosphodiesterase n=1 Tax=Phyllobacterium ifriqiyense TaxID=314238 RepID=UPI0033913102